MDIINDRSGTQKFVETDFVIENNKRYLMSFKCNGFAKVECFVLKDGEHKQVYDAWIGTAPVLVDLPYNKNFLSFREGKVFVRVTNDNTAQAYNKISEF